MPNLPARLLLAALGLAAVAATAAPPAPADPAASPAAHTVLAFLASLESRTERHLLTGQFTGYSDQASRHQPAKIHALSGQWPAMVGVDYAWFEQGSLDHREPNRTAIAYWRAGGLVTVSTHLYNPANPRGGGLRDKNVELDTLLDPQTETHRRWMRQLDQIAAGLQELQDAGVVVLWRPFHEMNGHWFWWGEKRPASFVRLWRHMFDYFTREKGLHNLLWVYGPNHGAKIDTYYPGDDVVDIVGLDAYTDHVDPGHITGGDLLARHAKPFGFTEFGPHGASDPPGNYDYRRLLAGLTAHFPRARFVLFWDAKWSPAENRFTREFFNDPRVLNRDALPPELTRPPAAPAPGGP